MRIVMTCDFVLDGKNAQTTHVIEMMRNLGKSNEVYVFTPMPLEICIRSSNIKYVWTFSNIPELRLLIYQILLFFKLLSFCIKKKVDIIYPWQSAMTFSPLIVSKILRIPYVVIINGLLADELSVIGRPGIYATIATFVERSGYKNARKIIAVTSGLKNCIQQLYTIPENKLTVIENGANIDTFKPMDMSMIRKKLGLELGYNYVCFVGALLKWQGVEYLVDCAPEVMGQIANTKFLIVGDGDLKNKLMETVKSNGTADSFIFTGPVPYADVPLYINASDICVAPFIKERNLKIGLSPLKIYEYAACGKPIVSTCIPSLEFIRDQGIGLLVEPNSPGALARAIVTLLNDGRLRDHMGKKGRDYIIKNNSWESVAKRIERIFKEVAGN